MGFIHANVFPSSTVAQKFWHPYKYPIGYQSYKYLFPRRRDNWHNFNIYAFYNGQPARMIYNPWLLILVNISSGSVWRQNDGTCNVGHAICRCWCYFRSQRRHLGMASTSYTDYLPPSNQIRSNWIRGLPPQDDVRPAWRKLTGFIELSGRSLFKNCRVTSSLTLTLFTLQNTRILLKKRTDQILKQSKYMPQKWTNIVGQVNVT